MKKGTQYTGSVSEVRFPNKGVVEVASEDGTVENCIVKNTLPGQKVKFRVNKKKNGSCVGKAASNRMGASNTITTLVIIK